MKTTSKFDDLNDTFNVTDDVVQPEVIEKKIDKIRAKKCIFECVWTRRLQQLLRIL